MITRRRLLVSASACRAVAVRGADSYYPPPDSAGGWHARKPDARQLAKFDEALECAKGSTKHGGLLVVHQGWLIYEKFFGLGSREATPNAASCGKAFTSVALGILLGERPDFFPDGLEQKVFTPRYLPEEAFPLDDPAKADIKLGQLLAMTAGLAGNNPAYVRGQAVKLTRTGADGWQAMVDHTALTTPFWTKPGRVLLCHGGPPHCLDHPATAHRDRVAELPGREGRPPAGMGPLGVRLPARRGDPHAGRRGNRHPCDRLATVRLPAAGPGPVGRTPDRTRMVRAPLRARSPYNPHYSYSLQFNVNTVGDLAPGAPRNAFWKGGSGGHCLYVVPSLDLVIYKLGGRDAQFDLAQTNVPPPPEGLLPPYDGSRETWKPSRSEPDRIPMGEVLRLAAQAFR